MVTFSTSKGKKGNSNKLQTAPGFCGWRGHVNSTKCLSPYFHFQQRALAWPQACLSRWMWMLTFVIFPILLQWRHSCFRGSHRGLLQPHMICINRVDTTTDFIPGSGLGPLSASCASRYSQKQARYKPLNSSTARDWNVKSGSLPFTPPLLLTSSHKRYNSTIIQCKKSWSSSLASLLKTKHTRHLTEHTSVLGFNFSFPKDM